MTTIKAYSNEYWQVDKDMRDRLNRDSSPNLPYGGASDWSRTYALDQAREKLLEQQNTVVVGNLPECDAYLEWQSQNQDVMADIRKVFR